MYGNKSFLKKNRVNPMLTKECFFFKDLYVPKSRGNDSFQVLN